MIIYINGMAFELLTEGEGPFDNNEAKFYESEPLVFVSFDGVYRLPTEAEYLDLNEKH